MLVTPIRSVLTDIPATQVMNHRKVLHLEHDDLNCITAVNQRAHRFIFSSPENVLTSPYSIYMLYDMTTQDLSELENEIEKIKNELRDIGEMRPGSLTLQYKVPDKKKGPYYQLSFTHKMRSRTQYVRPDQVGEIRKQIEVYKRFKNLIERWIGLAIEHS